METTQGSEVMAQMADSRGPIMLGATGRALPRQGRALRFLFTGVWLVYLIAPVYQLFGHHHSALWIAGGLVIAAAFCAIYVYVIGTWDRGWRMTRVGLATLFLLAVIACLIYGSDWLTLWVYVSAATGFVIPGRRLAMRAVLGVSACYAVLGWVTHASATTFLLNLLPVVLIGWAMIGFRYQATLVRELSLARETVAKLAASEERLRLARDMHDLTGQSLSMITLKSDLVGKLLGRLPQSKDRDAALHEASDISQVSRRTLHDIREAVSGYRRPTLAVEIITARTALEAAGIQLDDDPDLTLRSGTFDTEAEAALAWCLREATTNVIRHSGARKCRVRLIQRDGELSLEVTDDGRGLQGLAAQSGTGPATPPGSGLRGMSERLTALGGRLSLGDMKTGGGRGLRLVATVPDTPPQAVPEKLRPAVQETSGPAVPKTSGPAVPEMSGPGVPEMSGPAVPEMSGPGVPEMSGPAIPETSASAVPDTPAPAAAEMSGSAVPEMSGPGVPEMSGPAIPETPAPAAADDAGHPATVRREPGLSGRATSPASAPVRRD